MRDSGNQITNFIMEVENNCSEKFKTGISVDPITEYPANLKSEIESIAIKEGFITHNIKLKKISADGGNYLGVLYEIDIIGKTKNGDKEVNLFVKNIIPLSEKISEMMKISDQYLLECYIYRDLSKIFTDLQEKAGVPIEERYKIPKGYEESSSQIIITENMARKGYKTCDRIKVPPLKFFQLSVEQMARLHGLGFALQKKMPEYFEKHISKLQYPLEFNQEWLDFFKTMTDTSIQSIEDGYKLKVERFVSNAAEKVENYIKSENEICTICHGDFRASNILVNEHEGEVTEVILVDYQTVYCGCPANDFIYFIYGCTDRQFRRKHMDDLIELYYNTLTNFLKYFDIDVADVYPRNKFDTALKGRLGYGLILALTFFKFYYAEDKYPDLSEDDLGKHLPMPKVAIERLEEIIVEILG